ncbi:MAG: glycosyltransferase family 9 protein [Nitrospirae bacterium]|nr:glycosyltransferase family 9 protein [Nitrospirota bacterium]
MGGYVILYSLGRREHALALADELRRERPGASLVLVTPGGDMPDASFADAQLPASGLRDWLDARRDGAVNSRPRPLVFALAVSNEPRYTDPARIFRALLLMALTRPRARRVWLYGWSGRYTVPERLGDVLRAGLGMAARPLYLAGMRVLHAAGERLFPLVNGKKRTGGFRPGDAGRVLLMSLDLVGDLVWTGPAVRAVKACRPDTRVDMLVAGRNAGLARMLEGVDEVICYDAPWLRKVHNPSGGPGWRPGRWRNLMTRLRLLANRYDLALDFRGEARHAVLGYLTGAPFRAGFGRASAGSIRASDTAYLLTHDMGGVLAASGVCHILDRSLALVLALGYTVGDASAWLRAAPEDELRIRRILEDAGTGGHGPLIGMQPGASRAEKRWGLDGFAEVARGLMERRGARVVIAGSPDEAPLGARLAGAAPGAVDLCGQTTLGEFVALISACDLFISNDTSAISIASAVGTPLVCMVAVETGIMGPYGVRSAVLQRKPGCYDPVAEHCFCPYGYRCLQEITAEEVLAAAEEVLDG